MKSLIQQFNEIQDINKELKIEPMKLPQIVVIGSQSSGKSSVLESIVGSDFFPKGKGMVTRCPLRLELINDCVDGSDFQARFDHRNTVITSYGEISREIKSETNKRTKNEKNISEEELILEIKGQQFPTLTLVDLPGLIQNLEKDQPKDLDNVIIDIMKKYIEPDNSIILAVSPANVDLATSEIVKYAKEVDPQGRRTIHVLTKLDIMNEGENARDTLNCVYLSSSVAVIGVINRNEKDIQQKMSLNDQRAKEEKFFKEKYPELAERHGTKNLLKILEKVLTKSIQDFIPNFESRIKTNVLKYKKELENSEPNEKRIILLEKMNDFCKMYEKTLNGDLLSNTSVLEGGALISKCLYMTFYNEIKNLNISNLTDEEIQLTILNSSGTKDISLSFKKTFDQLIRIEIEKFREPCNDIINTVEATLNEFVKNIIEKIELFQYPKLEAIINAIAIHIITERTRKSTGMIQDFITGEIEDITFSNPFFDIITNFQNYPQMSQNKDNNGTTTITPGTLLKMVEYIGVTLPLPQYYSIILGGVVAFGLVSKLKQAYENKRFDEVINIVTDVIGRGIGLDFLKDKIVDDIKGNMEDFISKLKAYDSEMLDEHKNGIVTTQTLIIKNVMSLYFEMVRKNVLNYVPKTIQTFLIKGIWDQMLQGIQIELLKENIIDNIIFSESDATRIENLKHDLKKSLEMQEKLNRIRGMSI